MRREASPGRRLRPVLSPLILLLATLLGIIAFLFPFFIPAAAHSGPRSAAHAADAPFFFVLLLLLCLVALVANFETQRMNAKIIAALGILAAVGGVLRLVPGPGGFSAFFFLIILCGYVYGPDFGFVLGVVTLLVSAILSSGLGPWVAFQMFAAGWVGLSSSWLPDMSGLGSKLEVAALAVWGGVWGFLFGAIMNLWFWPYLIAPGQEALAWQGGLGAVQALARYGLFYAATSLWWDVSRAAGNFAFVLLLGIPVLRLLRRFKKRFQFEVT